MPAYLGTSAPSAFKVGSQDCSAIYLGGTQVWSPSAPPASTYSVTDDFTGTTGAAPKAMWTKAPSGGYPTGGTVTLQSGKMRVSTNSTTAWNPAMSVFLGDPNKPQGDSANGIPAIVSNAEYTFDYTLSSATAEHYPTILLRGRNAQMWPAPGGNGANLFTTGYMLVLGVTGTTGQGFIDIIQGYNAGNAASIDTITGITWTAAMKWRIKIDRSMLYLKWWPAANTEPTAWNYSKSVITDEGDGSIGFSVANGPATTAKYVEIDNFTAVMPVLTLGTDMQSAPTAAVAGFTKIWSEDFNNPATTGTGTGSFVQVYSGSFTPYDETGTIGDPNNPAMRPREMITAHDGVMDVAMDGTRASAGTFGNPSTAFNRIGGRFAIRMKAHGGFSNGPAFMVWPSDTPAGTWANGELDFPESVSGRGDNSMGFQDAPWIHHHQMTPPYSDAQDVPLLKSWRDWHVYTLEWYPPGKGPNPATGMVIYYVDDVEIYRTTTHIPSTVHRWCFQIGDYGYPGNIYIDWARMDAVT